MHAKLLFHVFNTTPKLNLCMFSSEMAHTPCTLSSVHVEYPTIKFRGDGSHSGQVMARKHMAHCASEPLRTLLTRTSPPHLARLPAADVRQMCVESPILCLMSERALGAFSTSSRSKLLEEPAARTGSTDGRDKLLRNLQRLRVPGGRSRNVGARHE